MAMADPGPTGRFGEFGGRFVPETLVPACQELEVAFRSAWDDPAFRGELDRLLRDYAGRPSPLTECERLSDELGVRILLKREDLNHTGSHKINNVLGQALLARRMGKHRLVAETGAGQHGVASATAAALLGMECVVYMGEVDIERQALNVRQPHPQGRHQRGHAGLGGVRGDHALLPRFGDGPPPLPVDGAPVPRRHWRRGPRPV
jgi:tryptophan synthase beta chain